MAKMLFWSEKHEHQSLVLLFFGFYNKANSYKYSRERWSQGWIQKKHLYFCDKTSGAVYGTYVRWKKVHYTYQ
jgi:hypothetical protein